MKGRVVLMLAATLIPVPLAAEPMTVVEARGTAFRPGMQVASTATVQLREGEKLTVVSMNGRLATLRGPYRGVVAPTVLASTSARAALGALVTTRRDRATSVGAVRSAAIAHPIPDPWMVDISRPGPRCVREGGPVTWWRADSTSEEQFTILPLDRSWKAEITWQAGQSTMPVPPGLRLEEGSSFVVRSDGRDNAISLNVIPATADQPLLLVAWMIEKGCAQQADALIRQLDQELPAEPAPSVLVP